MNTATTDSTSQPTRCVVDTKPPARRAGIALLGSMLVALGTGCQTAPAAAPHADLGSTPMTDNGSKENQRPTMKITESGSGRNILILHGGGGPATMTLLGAHLAEKAHVITPTYPGWDGTPRPESLTTVGALADEIVHYLDEHDVKDVLVIGSSIGGWIAPEVALRDRAHRVSGLVIINGTGVNVPGQPITNVTGFTPPQLAKVAFHDPSKFGAGAPPPTPERLAMMRANAATLAMFSGSGDTYSCDPRPARSIEGHPRPDPRALGRVGSRRHQGVRARVRRRDPERAVRDCRRRRTSPVARAARGDVPRSRSVRRRHSGRPASVREAVPR
jgi:pimeloyl-ACP methyl ester carboxylesterase